MKLHGSLKNRRSQKEITRFHRCETNAQKAYARARELMGVLETMALSERITNELMPIYRQCAQIGHFSGMSSNEILQMSENLTDRFIKISEELKSYA